MASNGRIRDSCSCLSRAPLLPLSTTSTDTCSMDDRKLLALARKNAAKSGTNSSVPKGFGKKYDKNLPDDPTDVETIKAREESKKFFSEMKKRDF
jgi:hypothetical protein